jgi:hypothetical protein
MKCACTLTPVLALAGLAALGFGGYNVMKTGCPLGACADRTPPAVTTVSQTVVAPTEPARDDSPCCAKGGAPAGTCPHAGDAQLVTASEQAAPHCAGKTDCPDAKDCPHKVNCDGKGECPMKTAGAAPSCPAHGASLATTVADKGAPETPKN